MFRWFLLLLFVNVPPLFGADQASFKKLVSDIVEARRIVKAAELRADASADSAKLAKLNMLPSLSAQGRRGLRSDHPLASSGIHHGFADIGVRTDLNLFKFGGDVAEQRLAEATAATSQIEWQTQRLAEEELAAGLVIRYLAAQKRYDVAKSRSDITARLLSSAKARYDRGQLSKQDDDKLQLDAATLAFEISKLKADLLSLQTEASAWTALDKVQTSWPLTKNSNFEGWLSKLQSSTPLSKIAEAKMRLADATLKQTRSAWLPSLDASYEWNKMFEPYGDATAQSSSAYLTLTVPLSSRMTSTRAYRTAIKERAASELEYDAALAGEAKRFEAERQLLQSLWRETQNWQRHVQKAESLYLQSSERFEKGYSTVNDLNLDARRLADIQETEISAWQDVHLKMFSLCKLSGNSCLDMLD